MNWNRLSYMLIVVSISMIFEPGCGSSDQPDLGQVTGTVTLDGRPVVGVAVVFQPDSGRPARGMTDANGKYELTYIRNTKGTKIGPNRVEIAPSEDGEVEESEVAEGEAQPAPKRKSGKPSIPPRYNVKTELKADVKPGENKFDFELES